MVKRARHIIRRPKRMGGQVRHRVPLVRMPAKNNFRPRIRRRIGR